MVTLHLVRHGETRQAADGVFCGDLDPPLTETGRAQAERAAQAVQALEPVALYCSPRARARSTAEPIARACSVAMTVEDGLREMAYGAWEGRQEAEVRATDPEAYAVWTADPALSAPPGGESGYAIAARAMPVVLRALEHHRSGHVILVSHKATIRIITCALLGISLTRFRSHIACPPASITSFEVTGSAAMLVRVGDVHHLT